MKGISEILIGKISPKGIRLGSIKTLADILNLGRPFLIIHSVVAS